MSDEPVGTLPPEKRPPDTFPTFPRDEPTDTLSPDTMPTLPGSDPHDGMRPPPWWKLDPQFLEWLAPAATRGIADGSLLTERDLATLRAASVALRSARARLLDGDRGQSARAGLELIQLTGYLSGFVDGKRIPGVAAGAMASGFSSNGADSLNDYLDHLESLLQVAMTPTRGPEDALLIVAGLGTMAVGAFYKLKAALQSDTVSD